MAARGLIVSHETVRRWALKFGQDFANRIRRRLPCAGDKWHLDEVAIKIAGTKHWLWRAVDQTGMVLDVLVQKRRDKRAAKRLPRKLLKRRSRAPRVMVTDKLASYPAAKKELMPGVEHRRHKGLNNRAENSHQPTRRREPQMKRFKSRRPGAAVPLRPRPNRQPFPLRRDHVTAVEYRAARTRAFEVVGRGQRRGAARRVVAPHLPSRGECVPRSKQVDGALVRRLWRRGRRLGQVKSSHVAWPARPAWPRKVRFGWREPQSTARRPMAAFPNAAQAGKRTSCFGGTGQSALGSNAAESGHGGWSRHLRPHGRSRFHDGRREIRRGPRCQHAPGMP